MGEITEYIHSFFKATIIYWVLNCSRHCARHGGGRNKWMDFDLKIVSSSPLGVVVQKLNSSFSLTPPGVHVCMFFFFFFFFKIDLKPLGFPGGPDGKESACNVWDPGSIPALERSPGEGNVYPLQYSCLENPMDRGAWQDAVHRVEKSQTRLSD